jgi:hypothetical protein
MGSRTILEDSRRGFVSVSVSPFGVRFVPVATVPMVGWRGGWNKQRRCNAPFSERE